MKEIREAAMAYYLNMPENVDQMACSLFQSMDRNGDGKITSTEFWTAYKQLDVSVKDLDQKLFLELDENGDGTLDFQEFLSLFYIVKSGRLMYCDGCKHFLKGLYFTCLPCFDQGHTTVNYCTACFRDRRHKNYHHVTFVDNYALLLSRSGPAYGTAQATQSGSSQPNQPNKAQSGSSQPGQSQPTNAQTMKEVFDYFVGGLAIGQAVGQAVGQTAVAASCSIM